MKIKKLICLALVPMIILAASCSNNKERQAVTQSAEPKVDYAGTVLNVCDRFAGNNPQSSLGYLNYSRLSLDTGIKFSTSRYLIDETKVKLLANDSDVDIYIVASSEVPDYMSTGYYEPIESDVIKEYIDNCHGALSELAYANDKIAFVPVSLSINAILIPISAINETEVTSEKIEYLDDFLEFVREYDGDRIAYTNSSSLFSDLENQYEILYFNGESDKDINFITPEYMHIYSEILSYTNSDDKIGATIGFEHNLTGDYSNNSEKALCTYGRYSSAETFTYSEIYDSEYRAAGATDFFEKWRAFPIPKISEEVTSNSASAAFAFINPFSENKEAALYVLETIASDFYKYAGKNSKYSMMFSDISAYPDYFYTDSDIFSDYFSMLKTAKLSKFVFPAARTDIDDYQAGKLTLEEAVAEYQRQVDIWLNE